MAESHPTPHRPSFQDLTGQNFGQLKVLEWDGFRNSYTYWKCLCEACGQIKVVSAQYLKKHHTGSCGCLRSKQVEKTCEQCGKTFKVKAYRAAEARFCSRACSGKAKPNLGVKRTGERFEIPCQKCGKTFIVAAHREHTARYCSTVCKKADRIEQVPRTCEHCGKTFTRYASTLLHGNQAGRFCSRSCWRLATVSAVHRVFLQGKCNRCGWCEEPQILTIHHKDRNRKNNVEENLELLCFTCHILEHFRAGDGPFYRPGPRTKRLRSTRLLLAQELMKELEEENDL